MNVHPYAYGQNPYIHYPYGVHYPVSGVQQPSANFYSDVQHPMDIQDQSTNFQANSPDVQHSFDVQSPSSSVYHPIDVHQYAEQPGNIQQAQDVELEMSIHSFPSSAYRSPSTVQSPLSFAEQRASVHLQTPSIQQTVPIVHQSPTDVQRPLSIQSPLSFAEQPATVQLQTPDVQQTVPIVHQSPSTVQDPVNWSSPNVQSPVHRPINVQSALSNATVQLQAPDVQQTVPVVHHSPSDVQRPLSVQSPLSVAELPAIVQLQTPDIQQTVTDVHQSPSRVQKPGNVSRSSPNIHSPVQPKQEHFIPDPK